jgi:hypothetical protein
MLLFMSQYSKKMYSDNFTAIKGLKIFFLKGDDMVRGVNWRHGPRC